MYSLRNKGETKMDFGDKLKQYRLKEGLSQEQLAEKIGVSRQAITKWETKRGLPDVENMIILAELFNLTLDELVLELPRRLRRLQTLCQTAHSGGSSLPNPAQLFLCPQRFLVRPLPLLPASRLS